MPTLGIVSRDGLALFFFGVSVCLSFFLVSVLDKIHTVSNHDGVDKQGQQGGLVLGRVVLEQSLDVVVADGLVLGTLAVDDGASRCGQGEGAETHDGKR